MSALLSLTISHFKSHKYTKLVFNGRPFAIYGANGAGKTNVLEAISLLSAGRGLRRSRLDEFARHPENIGWKIAAQIKVDTQTHIIETGAQEQNPRSVTIDNKPSSQIALSRLLRVLWLVPTMDRLWVEGAEGRRSFIDRIALSFTPDHAEASLSYEKAIRQRNRLLKDQVRDAYWYQALEAQMAKSAQKIIQNRAYAIDQLISAQQNVYTAFPTANLSIKDAPANPGELEHLWRTTRQHDMNAGRTLIGPHKADINVIYSTKNIPAAKCSTGEQKALLISIILANTRALNSLLGISPIVLLDEVAAHLDQNRRAALYDEICALQAQAFMTATDADLFDSLSNRGQYLHISDHHGYSLAKPE